MLVCLLFLGHVVDGCQDGVRALGSYLEGAAGTRFCPLLDQQTAVLRANDRIPCKLMTFHMSSTLNPKP